MSTGIEKDVISVIADVSGFDEDEIGPGMHMQNDLEIDSIKAIEITVALEKKYRISIRDEDIPNIVTVGQAIETVRKLLENKTEGNAEK